MPGRIVLYGATGYMGALTARAMVASGARPVLAGRDQSRLSALAARLSQAGDGTELETAVAVGPGPLRDLIGAGDVLVSTAGPFMKVGRPVVAAAVDAGAVYLDSTGEPPFIREVFEEFGPRAERTGAVLLTAFGYDYVPGNLAGALALEERPPSAGGTCFSLAQAQFRCPGVLARQEREDRVLRFELGTGVRSRLEERDRLGDTEMVEHGRKTREEPAFRPELANDRVQPIESSVPSLRGVAHLYQRRNGLDHRLDDLECVVVAELAGGVFEVAWVGRDDDEALHLVGAIKVGVVGEPQTLIRVMRCEIEAPYEAAAILLPVLGRHVRVVANLATGLHTRDADYYVASRVVLAEGVAVVRVVEDEASVVLYLIEVLLGVSETLVVVVCLTGAVVLYFWPVHLLEGPDADSRGRQVPGHPLVRRIPTGWVRIATDRLVAEGVDAVHAGRRAISTCARGTGVRDLPIEISTDPDLVAGVGVVPHAKRVGGGVSAHVAVPALHVPCNASGQVDGHDLVASPKAEMHE